MTSASDPSIPVPSPCTGICRIDEGSGWCNGCLRSLDEIVAWGTASDGERRRVLRLIERRRSPSTDASASGEVEG